MRLFSTLSVYMGKETYHEVQVMNQDNDNKIRATVRRYYGDIAARRSAGCGCEPSSCCSGDDQPTQAVREAERLGYTRADILAVSDGSEPSLGCGNPIGIARLRRGERVVDLGSGTGFDCLLAAKQVGESGLVIGVDMTPEMIERARTNARRRGYSNVEFRLGEIEHLPVGDNSIDVIISNCVINLSPTKTDVFKEAYRVLRPGGRLAISDVVAVRELPQSIKADQGYYCGCVSGAAQIEELRQMIGDAGFENISISTVDRSKEFIREWVPGSRIDDYVISAYIEAFKPRQAEKNTGTTSKRYFDEVASQWDAMRTGFFPNAVREKAIAVAGIQAGSLAADIGAGSGFVTEELLRQGAKIIAIDQSDAMLEVMKKKFEGRSEIEYRTGEAENLPAASNSLDFAFANMYLHHVEHPAAAIREMARILKPGGKLVITDLDEHSFGFLQTEHRDRWMGFKREDVEKWFVDAGLKDAKVDCIGDTCCASSEAGQGKAQVSIFIASGTKPLP